MNENLSIKLYDAYRIAQERERANSDYSSELSKIRSRQAAADEVTRAMRNKYARIPLVTFFLGYGALMLLTYNGQQDPWEPLEISPLKVILAIIAAISAIFAIVRFFGAEKIYYKTEKYKKECAVIEADKRENARAYLEKLNAINSKSGAWVPGLPEKYHTTRALEYMQECVCYGVSTIKELVQMYEEKCHREHMEDMQDRILAEVEEQANRTVEVHYVTWYS